MVILRKNVRYLKGKYFVVLVYLPFDIFTGTSDNLASWVMTKIIVKIYLMKIEK